MEVSPISHVYPVTHSGIPQKTITLHLSNGGQVCMHFYNDGIYYYYLEQKGWAHIYSSESNGFNFFWSIVNEASTMRISFKILNLINSTAILNYNVIGDIFYFIIIKLYCFH